MSLAVNVGRQLFKRKAYLYSAIKCHSTDKSRTPWNHLWTPEEYKKENHAKHAEKYHMHPDEYKPNPLTHGTGDYPALPWIGPAAKDPHYPYDDPINKRNYHEPLHAQHEIMSEDRYNFGYKYFIEPEYAVLIFLSVVAGFALLIYLTEPYSIMLRASMAKQYPSKDKTHYTFEPAE